MQEYTIVRVEEEIARHYFQKSDLLYRFLTTFKHQQDRDDLQRQFSYITRSFSLERIVFQLLDVYTCSPVLIKKGNYIEISTEENRITLHLSEKHIKFRCDTMQDAEVLLFPALRKIYPYLFVVCQDYVNYGWVSPIANKEQQKHGQVLYSYH